MTKKQSAILQGVAIWMMVYHHLYSFVVEYESLLPFMQVDTVRRIAWFCKLCVGIFAFVSGYGMYYVMKGQNGERFGGRLLAEYRGALLRILKLYGRLWLVLAIYMGIFFGILRQPFMADQLLGNLTALDPTYNGAWWYVEQYAKILLVLPLLDLLLIHPPQPEERRKKWIFFLVLALVGAGAALVGRLWWPALWDLMLAAVKSMRISFLLIAVVGYLTARYA
ncbi:MAG: acyltransferase family protein, partial [Acetatifactor sp.]|nr:acyltransferase family protein [Acetatifactor sp.]